MLSILIPIYNFNVNSLVKKLSNELINNKIKGEIICLDDASSNKKIVEANKKVQNLKNCNYQILSENIGRSKIRNLLASKANYNNLLFLDCDTMPVTDNFIQTYIHEVKKNRLIFGGLQLPDSFSHEEHSLHFKYSKKREIKSFEERKYIFKNNFTTANFLVNKQVFQKVLFDENVDSYGYEDIVFAKSLIGNKVVIEQINNPVTHLGILANSNDYLEKIQKSLHTLKAAQEKGLISKNEVKLLKYYSILKKMKMIGLYKLFYKLFKPFFLKNLLSKNASLVIFDLYKLGYYSNI